jgi:hypothetical protein
MKKVDKTQEYLNCIFFLNQDYSGFLASESPIPGDYPLSKLLIPALMAAFAHTCK